MKIELLGLDIGEIVVAGLSSLGRLPQPDKKLTKYRVTVKDGSPNLPGFVCDTIQYPKIVISDEH